MGSTVLATCTQPNCCLYPRVSIWDQWVPLFLQHVPSQIVVCTLESPYETNGFHCSCNMYPAKLLFVPYSLHRRPLGFTVLATCTQSNSCLYPIVSIGDHWVSLCSQHVPSQIVVCTLESPWETTGFHCARNIVNYDHKCTYNKKKLHNAILSR